MPDDRSRNPFKQQHTLARLVLLDGENAGAIYPLYGPQVVIGRLDSSDLQLHDGTVSRLHARVLQQDQQFVVEDLGSRGGTQVNEEQVEGSQQLSDGDTILVGKIALRFER